MSHFLFQNVSNYLNDSSLKGPFYCSIFGIGIPSIVEFLENYSITFRVIQFLSTGWADTTTNDIISGGEIQEKKILPESFYFLVLHH